MNKLKRYILFLTGLFINSLGVSLVTKANLVHRQFLRFHMY